MIASKTEIVKRLVLEGNYKRALHIAKGFQIGEKEELGKIALAYECMVHSRFYQQLGTDIGKAVSEGVEVLKTLYGQSEESS